MGGADWDALNTDHTQDHVTLPIPIGSCTDITMQISTSVTKISTGRIADRIVYFFILQTLCSANDEFVKMHISKYPEIDMHRHTSTRS